MWKSHAKIKSLIRLYDCKLVYFIVNYTLSWLVSSLFENNYITELHNSGLIILTRNKILLFACSSWRCMAKTWPFIFRKSIDTTLFFIYVIRMDNKDAEKMLQILNEDKKILFHAKLIVIPTYILIKFYKQIL